MAATEDIVYGRFALGQGVPWITPESLEHLERIIKPEWKVFEWGSGGSTVYWARKCQECVSIEHNSEWVSRTGGMLAKFGVSADLRYVAGELEKGPDAFRTYANAILEFPDGYFDCVYVDGEASSRGWAIKNAISKLKGPGSLLLIDNSNWYTITPNGFERFDYIEKELKWIGQPGTFDWWTSLFIKL